uniref:Phosphotransferase n=1 Tax=Angiostrongylus cantonensis TaxID=6313 RepID=A0A0K0D436_ANGCA
MKGKIYGTTVPIQQKTGEELFDHIAECIALFTNEQFDSNKKKLRLGFIFSYPLKQERLTRAKLITWTKEINAIQLLRKACKRRKDVEIHAVAVLNDIVGTLMACAFEENTCKIGVIVETGRNAYYLEKLSRVEKMKGEWENGGLSDEVIIDMEWGGFGDDGSISLAYTEYKTVDKSTTNSEKQAFEKMISGMYIGELVCVVIETLAKKGVAFKGSTDGISKEGYITTTHASAAESEMISDGSAHSYPKTREMFQNIDVTNISGEDCLHFGYICAMGYTFVRGSSSVEPHLALIRHLNSGAKYQLMLLKDGSDDGVAVVAAENGK